MTRDEAEGFLTEIGGKADGGFPLLEAALACAVHEDPGRDPELGAQLRRRRRRSG